MNNKGQISAEFILIVGFILVLIISTSYVIKNENELNIAMAAARNGVNEGILTDSVAIYPKQTFDEYELNKPFLTHPYSIRLVKIDYINKGFDSNYNKERIQFKVYVSSDSITNKTDQDSAGDRINFNLRKSIAISFNTTGLSNSLYNPSFSDNYMFTTSKVQWV